MIRSIFILTLLAFLAGTAGAGQKEFPMGNFPREKYHVSPGHTKGTRGIANRITERGTNILNVWYDHRSAATRQKTFLRIQIGEKILGKPEFIIIKVHSDSVQEVPIACIFKDAGMEQYISRVKIKPGDNELKIKISNRPAWPSGDKNNQKDYPLNLDSILIQPSAKLSESTGNLLFESIKVISDINPQEGVILNMNYQDWNYGKENPVIMADFSNLFPEYAGKFAWRFTAVDSYSGKQVFEKTRWFTLPFKNNQHKEKIELKLPYGMFKCRIDFFNDKSGKSYRFEDFVIRKLTDPNDIYASEAEQKYEFLYGVNGGVIGFISPGNAQKIGINNFRYSKPTWFTIETERGKFNFDEYVKNAKIWVRHNIRPISLVSLYHIPEFVDKSNNIDISSSLGRYYDLMTKAAGKLVTCHEIGNEDNGNSRFFYTEVARHAAAAVRANQSRSVLSNSGTAFIDIAWLKFQQQRGLLDYFDAFCVHPYTNNSTASEAVSPEKSGTLQKLEALNDVSFDAGGMRVFWSTEFGWPNGDHKAEVARAKLYVREMLITDAANLAVNGLYTWERDYGTVKYPAGIAIHNFAKRRQGARFAGMHIDKKTNIYTSLYDKSGKYYAVIWTPDSKTHKLNYGDINNVTDFFGNPIDASGAVISQEPLYISNPPGKLIEKVLAAHLTRIKTNFIKQIRRKGNASKVSAYFKSFAEIAPEDAVALTKKFHEFFTRTSKLNKIDTACLSYVLNWVLEAQRYSADKLDGQGKSFDFKRFENFIDQENAGLVDHLPLRYIVRLARKFELEAQMAKNSGNKEYMDKCRALLGLLDKVAVQIMKRTKGFQYAVFANIYTGRQGSLRENLEFIPAQKQILKVRVSSYAKNKVKGTVRLLLPKDWKVDPEYREFELANMEDVLLDFTVIPGNSVPETLGACVSLANKPDNKSFTENFKIIPSVYVKIPVRSTFLEDNEFEYLVSNKENKEVAGKVTFMYKGIRGAGFIPTRFKLAPGETRCFKVKLSVGTICKLKADNYSLDALVVLDDSRRFEIKNLDIDFTGAIKFTTPPVIDAKLSEWKNALPLKLNRPEYTIGSYGSAWSESDCSAITYTAWDDKNFYFAGIVKDQTFNQRNYGETMWQQDSIQLVFSEGTKKKRDSYTFALSPEGPVLWNQNKRRSVPGGNIAVIYKDGRIIYEVQIPWQDFTPQLRQAMKKGKFHYSVAVNDDDAIIPRRYLERFDGTIIHLKDASKTPLTVLLSAGSTEHVMPVADKKGNRQLFFDDFTSYEKGRYPADYELKKAKLPINAMIVTDKGLLIKARKSAPHTFFILTYPLKFDPNKKYIVSAEVSGDLPGTSFIGLCSDMFGIKDSAYIKMPAGKTGNKTFSSRPKNYNSGEGKIVIRNTGTHQDIYVRSIKVEPVQE